ncbi:MAG: hypothetical protein EXQ94_06550 [Alphaproteobacteria bacterium]|nr:hypothetical protein [Alphaproteobacteria bacterium]
MTHRLDARVDRLRAARDVWAAHKIALAAGHAPTGLAGALAKDLSAATLAVDTDIVRTGILT